MSINNWNTWLENNRNSIIGRILIIDTNVLVNDYTVLDRFVNDTVVIADVVLDELENLHKTKGLVEARYAISNIHKRKSLNQQTILIAPVGKYKGYTDKILLDGANISKSYFDTELVTGDKNLHLLADGHGIKVIFINVNKSNSNNSTYHPTYWKNNTLRSAFLYFLFFIFLISTTESIYSFDLKSTLFSIFLPILLYYTVLIFYISFKIGIYKQKAHSELKDTFMNVFMKNIHIPAKTVVRYVCKICLFFERFLPITLVSIILFLFWWYFFIFLFNLPSYFFHLFIWKSFDDYIAIFISTIYSGILTRITINYKEFFNRNSA